MRIKELLDRKEQKPLTINADATVHEAIQKMNKHHVGALVVTEWELPKEDERPSSEHRHVRYSWGGTSTSIMRSQAVCGLLSERDVLVECGERCQRIGKDASDAQGCPILVRDVMTKDENLIIGLPDDDVEYALRVMSGKDIKHLPILEEGELIGVVSMGDIIRAKVEHTAYEARMLKDYIQGVY